MKQYSYLLVGGDKRQLILYQSLKSKGYRVEQILQTKNKDIKTQLENIKDFDVIILPIPSSRDGLNIYAPEIETKIPLTDITEKIKSDSVLFTGGENPAFTACGAKHKIDMLANETMTMKNAMATAEAAIAIIITQTEKTIFNENVLIIGFGRIAKIMANYLSALKANVTVCARKEIARTEAELMGARAIGFDMLKGQIGYNSIIINTVPAPVISKKELLSANKNTLFLDLASKPGGIDFLAAEALGLKAIHALSLPGKYSPRSAAEYIEQTVFNTLVL